MFRIYYTKKKIYFNKNRKRKRYLNNRIYTAFKIYNIMKFSGEWMELQKNSQTKCINSDPKRQTCVYLLKCGC